MSNYPLTDVTANILLSTRCFGRATPFPHRLMTQVAAALSDTPYADIRKELEQHKYIKPMGKHAFDITRDGKDWLGYRKLDFEVFSAAMKGVSETVPQSIKAKDNKVVELMVIHAAALANGLYNKDKELYTYFMGLSIHCQIHIGDLDKAQYELNRLMALHAELKQQKPN